VSAPAELEFEVYEVSESKNIGFSFVMLVATGLVVMGVMQAMGGLLKGGVAAQPESAAALVERIKPVGQLNTGAPIVAEAPQGEAGAAPAAATSGPARTGEQVFNSTCTACHSTGAAGAPKLGDKAAWGPRIAQGMSVLVNNATNGIRAMPPRGSCPNCSDEELRNAVGFMVSKSK
jgi:cytochrome c5